MANIKFNRRKFEKEIGTLDEAMQNKIAMFGTTLENLTDNEIEIDVTPNRPDLLPYQGFKRAFLSFLDKKTGLKNYALNKPEKDYRVIVDSSVNEIRPHTACAIVKGLTLDDSKIKEIIDIQEKLHFTLGRKRKKFAIGVYPLEKVKLPIIYKAIEPDKIKFIPLEGKKEMSGLEILQRHPAGKEYAHLLKGKPKFPVFMDSDENILSMPPIINSEFSGRVTEKTKDIFIECSGFEREILEKCLSILVTSLAEMGGKIYQMNVKNIVTPNLKTEKRKISLENTNKILGLKLSERELKKLLERMGHNYSKGEVESPSWRFDIMHEMDLIEDVAIAYGYENFSPEIPQISTIGEENKEELIKRKISEILSGIEMIELSNYHLTTRINQFRNMGIQEKQEKGFIKIEESKTENDILRKNISHYILKVLSENVDSEYPQKIFEVGRIFEINNEGKIKESESLCAAISPGNFTEIKQILLYLSEMLEIKLELKVPQEIPEHFINGRTAEIVLSNKLIGYIGEIHPKILRNWKIKMPVALFEIGLEEIFRILEK